MHTNCGYHQRIYTYGIYSHFKILLNEQSLVPKQGWTLNTHIPTNIMTPADITTHVT